MKAEKYPKDAWTIQPGKTALVVIDMQRGFVDAGAPLECLGARELVPGINKLAQRCRQLKIPVVFVRVGFRADLPDTGLSPYFRDESLKASELFPEEGRKGGDFCPGLVMTGDDYIVSKLRYSALILGSSSLESLLRWLGRDSFMICGVATDVCVGTTTMDGMMLGFRVFFIGDLTATFSEERRQAALEAYDRHFARVMTLAEVMKELA